MSRQQWGHGFHQGMRKAESQAGEGYVGLFLHLLVDNKLAYQGVVRKEMKDGKLFVTWISWSSCDMESSSIIENTPDILWYFTAKEMREAYCRFLDNGDYGVRLDPDGARMTRSIEQFLGLRS